MTTNEIKLAAFQAIELLQGARQGNADAVTRKNRRDQAGELLASLPSKWWKRLSEKDSDMITTALADGA